METLEHQQPKTGTTPAKQARAKRTMERVERAARTLLNEKPWAEISMAQLAEAAEASIGSIYARFASKAALLDHLDELYCREMIVLNQDLLDDSREVRLADALMKFVRGLMHYHRDNHGLIRTVVLEARTADHPAFHARSERMNTALGIACKRFVAIAKAEGHDVEPQHMGWALFLVATTMRELILFPRGVPRPATGAEEQTRMIVQVALGYLTQVAEGDGS